MGTLGYRGHWGWKQVEEKKNIGESVRSVMHKCVPQLESDHAGLLENLQKGSTFQISNKLGIALGWCTPNQFSCRISNIIKTGHQNVLFGQEQWSPTLFPEIFHPVGFYSNLNSAYPIPLIHSSSKSPTGKGCVLRFGWNGKMNDGGSPKIRLETTGQEFLAERITFGMITVLVNICIHEWKHKSILFFWKTCSSHYAALNMRPHKCAVSKGLQAV